MERLRFTPRGQEVPAYDPAFVDELMSEGYDYATALYIASTEMEGANETEWGTIHALQTYCDELDYNEDLDDYDYDFLEP